MPGFARDVVDEEARNDREEHHDRQAFHEDQTNADEYQEERDEQLKPRLSRTPVPF